MLTAMKISMLLSAMLSFGFLCACASCEKDGEDFETMNTGGQPSQASDTTTAADAPSLLYMGQASIRVTTGEGRVIYIDPYAGDGYGLSADLILVTHEHFDHNAVDKVRHRNEGCRIIRARDAVIDGVHQTFDLGYVKVEAVEAGYNRYHDVRSCAGYVLTFNNGQKVYVSGDTSTTKQMERMSDMHIDYAFLCTDGLYNMGNEEAAEAARKINARYNIPYHNDTSNRGEMFDCDAAERFDAPNKMIVLPGETIRIE